MDTLKLNVIKRKWLKLPEDFKKKWVDALRSGNYKKTKNTLCREKEINGDKEYQYCVLGVAGHISGIENKSLAGKGDIGNYDTKEYYDKGLPKELVKDDELRQKLISMNDGKNYSFERLANWINKNL